MARKKDDEIEQKVAADEVPAEEVAVEIEQHDDPLLTMREVAAMVRKSDQTIRRWINDGLLECVRLPTGIPAVRKSAIDRFIGGSALANSRK